eukprot:COSAG02_NODE_9290_length_2265_cov_1.508772_1_plen_57_part_10
MHAGSRALLLFGACLAVALPGPAHGGEPDVPPPAAEGGGEGGEGGEGGVGSPREFSA